MQFQFFLLKIFFKFLKLTEKSLIKCSFTKADYWHTKSYRYISKSEKTTLKVYAKAHVSYICERIEGDLCVCTMLSNKRDILQLHAIK